MPAKKNTKAPPKGAPAPRGAKKVRKVQLPPIPDEVVTAVGPIEVVWVTGILENEECVGKFDWRSRTISLDDKLSLHSAWVTLEHEIVHAVLMDAGIVNWPDAGQHGSDLEERICDALAAARVAQRINEAA